MKAGHQHIGLTAQHSVAINRSENFNALADPFDLGGANENRVEWRVESVDLEVRLEGVDLASVAVAGSRNVHGAEGVLVVATVTNLRCHQNQTGAGTKDWETVGHAGTQRLKHRGALKQHRHCARFTTRYDQAVDQSELLDRADLHGRDAEQFENLCVDGKGALEGENANFWRGQARVTNRARRAWFRAWRSQDPSSHRPDQWTPSRGLPDLESGWRPRRWPWPSWPVRRS